jgi:hypothetical protein
VETGQDNPQIKSDVSWGSGSLTGSLSSLFRQRLVVIAGPPWLGQSPPLAAEIRGNSQDIETVEIANNCKTPHHQQQPRLRRGAGLRAAAAGVAVILFLS